MLLSQKLANFTKGEADTLRKAMGKKQRNVLDKMYPKFIEGGKANNLDETKLQKIWKDWEAFAEYAFNKSHSTCYTLIAYHTAYLKANYPAEYMASVMSNNINNTAQITMFMEDCKSMGVDVLGPDVNESQYKFSVNEKGQIRFGLGAIKGIGEGPSEAIDQERQKGKFKDVFDFFERVSSSQVNKRVVEGLVMAGAFDELDTYHRAQYLEPDSSGKTAVEKLLRYGQNYNESKSSVENSLFADMMEEVQIERFKIEPQPEWSNMYKLNKEKETIGFYLSAHPIDEFKYQYKYMQGSLSKRSIIEKEKKNEPEEHLDVAGAGMDADILEDENIDFGMDAESEEMVEETTKKIEPRGFHNFLNLDEVENYKSTIIANNVPETNLSWKDRQNNMNKGKEYTVAGMITEYTVRDGKRGGEKVAFLTLEDYAGSCSFRLGDRDYMRLKDKIAPQRFVILKIKYSVSHDGRCFVNVNDVLELRDAFDKFAKSLTVVMPVQDLKKEDIEFFRNEILTNKGEHKLSFYIKNPEDNSIIELVSMQHKIRIDDNVLKMIHKVGRYDVFLN
jgi:DNA polymerase III, alpha subunit